MSYRRSSLMRSWTLYVFLHTTLIPWLTRLRIQLQEAAINLMLVDLVTLIRERLAQPPLERVLASSDSVQRQTKPYISADAFKQLACVVTVRFLPLTTFGFAIQ